MGLQLWRCNYYTRVKIKNREQKVCLCSEPELRQKNRKPPLCRRSVTVARGVTMSARAPPAPPPKEIAPGSTPKGFQEDALLFEAGLNVRPPWRAAKSRGKVLACKLWLTFKITRRYSLKGGEVYSATLGNFGHRSAREGSLSVAFTSKGEHADSHPAACSASINSARANEAGSSIS